MRWMAPYLICLVEALQTTKAQKENIFTDFENGNHVNQDEKLLCLTHDAYTTFHTSKS